MGTPGFAVPILEDLLKNHRVLAVVTQPDKKNARNNKIIFSEVKQKALESGVKIFQPAKVKEIAEDLKNLSPDVFIVAAFGQMLPKEILEIPPAGAINVHASLLPKLRGASPIARAIMDGETKTGVTIMQMNEGMDTGDIILKEEIDIDPDDSAGSLSKKLSSLGAKLLEEALYTPNREKQNDAEATYCGLLKKEMGMINFNKSAAEIKNLIRAFDPQPGAFTQIGGRAVKVWRAEIGGSAPGVPGEILDIKDGITIKTPDASITLTELQREGKKRMNARDFVRGFKINVGEII
jgi:methionyl-tRNA formyltransferase